MRRVSTLLILSLFVGLMNLATMPFASAGQLEPASNLSEISGVHSHCEEIQNTGSVNDEIKINKSIDHFCCSIFAVIPATTIVSIPHQETTYMILPIEQKISHIENSIYKPPKQLSA